MTSQSLPANIFDSKACDETEKSKTRMIHLAFRGSKSLK